MSVHRFQTFPQSQVVNFSIALSAVKLTTFLDQQSNFYTNQVINFEHSFLAREKVTPFLVQQINKYISIFAHSLKKIRSEATPKSGSEAVFSLAAHRS